MSAVRAADHLDSPFVVLDPKIDITDVYVFHPGSAGAQDLSKLVFVLNIHPLTPPAMKPTFSDNSVYQFKIDNTGDAVEDIAYQITFTKATNAGAQNVTLRRTEGAQARDATLGTSISTGPTEKILSITGGSKLFAGLRDDPFFFDLGAFKNGLSFCSVGTAPDTFAGTNVLSIVVEVPTKAVGSNSNIGVWAEILQPDATGKLQQVDRMGRPAINTVFIPSDKKNAFNAGDPKDDQANFKSNVVTVLQALGNSQSTANTLANVLLPDMLTVDTSKETKFLNGRGLADDVIDAELGLITGGAVASDCVDGNDKPFQSYFPYLAGPHAAPTLGSAGPQGPKGDTGAQGPQGIQGPSGGEFGTGTITAIVVAVIGIVIGAASLFRKGKSAS
jgi:hypothetical protein